jgi:formyl-CoA transferase
MNRLPLEGVTVLDLSQIYNGPYATFMLAQAGADIIKVEPLGGENLRRRGVVGGAALPFAMLNGNKRTVTLNLKAPRGREILIDLAKRADILVENFAPGVMERLNLGYDFLKTLNPRLIYGQSSGYGRSGPNMNYPAMDLTVQAMSGIMSITGFPDRPPVKAGPALCDFFAGVHLYGAIVTALYEREKTGVGRLVEVAMQDAVYASLSSSLGLLAGSGAAAMQRTGNRHGGLAESPYNVYPTKDGYIAIICVGENHWKSLVKVMGRPELLTDPRFADLKTRVANMDTVDEIVSAFTKTFDKQPLFDLLMANHVPCAPVRELAEVVNDAHMHARGSLQYLDHPDLGRIVVQQSPLRFDGTPMRALKPSAKLGQHNAEIYGDMLGISESERADLKKEGVI